MGSTNLYKTKSRVQNLILKSSPPPLTKIIYLSELLARRQNAWSQDGGNIRKCKSDC